MKNKTNATKKIINIRAFPYKSIFELSNSYTKSFLYLL